MEVLYDGKPTGNLHVVSVQITNESQTDLSNLELVTELNEGSFVLRNAAQVRGSANLLGFSGGYAAILAQAAKRALTQPELDVWSRRSDFMAPVLNRGGVVDIRLLVTRNDKMPPVAAMRADHLGVRLRHEKPAQQFWGVHQGRASIVGLVIGLAASVEVVRLGIASPLGAVLPWLTGALGVLLGAGLIKAWRWISRLAD